MNKPIQTEGRTKKDRSRRHQPAGAQNEMDEILSDPQPGIGQETAPVENTYGTVAEAIFGGIDAQGPLTETKTEGTVAKSIFGDYPAPVILEAPYVPLQSDESRFGREAGVPIVTNGGMSMLNSAEDVVSEAFLMPSYVTPEQLRGRIEFPPAVMTPAAREHLRIGEPEVSAEDFTKLAQPMVKVLVRTLPTAAPVDLHVLKALMTKNYHRISGLARGYKLTRGTSGFNFEQELSEVQLDFIEGPKRERSKLFEAWSKLVQRNGCNPGTTISLYIAAFDGLPTNNPEDIVDLWVAMLYPISIGLDSLRVENTSVVTHAQTEFSVCFGGTTSRVNDIPEGIGALLVAP